MVFCPLCVAPPSHVMGSGDTEPNAGSVWGCTGGSLSPSFNCSPSLWFCRHYDIKRNDDIVSFFNDFSDHLAEEALWELSLKIKPRNITRRKTDREEKT